MTTPKKPGAPLLERLFAEARAAGFDDVGACTADVDQPYVDALRGALDDGRYDVFPWMARTLDQRLHVRGRIPRAKSVVVVLQSYYQGDHADHVDVDVLEAGARVSRYAWGQDYHGIMRRKLRRLRKWLLQHAPEHIAVDDDAVVAPFNDVDAVTERAWAVACGLGFIGKSAMFISRRHGTYTFIGGLITSLDLWADQSSTTETPTETTTTTTAIPARVRDACGSCTRCLDACPTGAITAPHVVDPHRCLTTWNVEAATDPRADDFAGSGWALGCDVCQEVCPWNTFATWTTEPRFAPQHVVLTATSPPTAEAIAGTPLARPGVEVLPLLAERARRPAGPGLRTPSPSSASYGPDAPLTPVRPRTQRPALLSAPSSISHDKEKP